ncbi:hypothetical protein HK097_000143, partial [Rhizophlyctis rosea]
MTTGDFSPLPSAALSSLDGSSSSTSPEAASVHSSTSNTSKQKRRPLSALLHLHKDKSKDPKEKDKDKLIRRLTSFQLINHKHTPIDESSKDDAGVESPAIAKPSKAELERLKKEEKERKKREKKELKEAKKSKLAPIAVAPSPLTRSDSVDTLKMAALAADLESQVLAKRGSMSPISPDATHSGEQALEVAELRSKSPSPSPEVPHTPEPPSLSNSASTPASSNPTSPAALRSPDAFEDLYTPPDVDHANHDDTDAVERFLSHSSLHSRQSSLTDDHDSLAAVRRRYSKSSFYSIEPEQRTPLSDHGSDEDEEPDSAFHLDEHFDPLAAAGPELNLNLWEVPKKESVVQSLVEEGVYGGEKRNPWLRNLSK